MSTEIEILNTTHVRWYFILHNIILYTASRGKERRFRNNIKFTYLCIW